MKNLPEKVPVSAVIITLNAEPTFEGVLRSLSWCDEIIVVDSGSKDCTLALAEKYHSVIFHRAFDGFGTQKRFAVSKARHDWVFSVDADEVVSKKLADEIRGLFSSPEMPCQGYYLSIATYFLGRILKHGGECSRYHLRLFNRNYGDYNCNLVHEKVEVQGKTERLKNVMINYSIISLTQYFDKFNRYTTLSSEDMAKKGKPQSTAKVFLKFPLTFCMRYFAKRGFLDGYQGFLWALFAAMYAVVKYAKLNEIKVTKNNLLVAAEG